MSLPQSPRRRPAADESGSIIILTALSMVVMLGIVALAVDASFMYTERNRMAAAADAAAKSAAFENHLHPGSNLQAFANREVVSHGFDPAAATNVTVNRPPLSGPYTSDTNYVEVYVSRPTASFFARILNTAWESLTPLTRAVAGTSAGPNCIITLDSSGTSLDIGGTAHINLTNCGIQASGDMHVGNGVGTVTAAAIGVEGSCSGCPAWTDTNLPALDPLEWLPEPTNWYISPSLNPGNPYNTAPGVINIGNNQGSPSVRVHIDPGWYSEIHIGNNDYVEFGAGPYWISGPITINNQADLTGSGVMFFLAGTAGAGPCTVASTSGCINIVNQATVQFSAWTTDPYSGILFFQARSNQIDADFKNTGDYNLSGAMYFPGATVTFGNSGGITNDCTLFVARNFNLASSGGGNMNFTNTCGAYGGSPLLTVSLAE
jgi:Flp pilus assembly protein TadG